MFSRRAQELHFVEAELDADVVDGACLALAGSDAVELGADR
jgi:hypothetical protein